MKSQSYDIEYAQALARADKERHAAIESADKLLQGASTPEAQAEAATHLIGVTEQAEIDFRDKVSRAADKKARENRQLELVGQAFGETS